MSVFMDERRIVAVCGAKNSGKTTLIEGLVASLKRRGVNVAVIKHASHRFEPDREGTDSFRALSAGAAGSAIFDSEKYQIIRHASVSERELAEFFPNADLILLEGFRNSPWPKIEIMGPGQIRPVSDPASWLALVTDGPFRKNGIRTFSAGEADEIAAFLLDRLRGGESFSIQGGSSVDEKALWEKCVEFHGHDCGGLAIGFKAALCAAELLGLSFSQDEGTVCISENDACGVDAVQVVLGCSVGKGNLLFHMTGKQAFPFYRRDTGRSVRLVLRPKPSGLSREQSFAYYRTTAPGELFDVKETRIALPEEARIFQSIRCDLCGEVAASHWIRIKDGKMLCTDCYRSYDRFHI